MRFTMTTRTSQSQVTFQRPFRLAGMDAAAPAGSYGMTVEEEQLDAQTVEAWRRTAVILQIATAGVTEHVAIDPQELRDALARDADHAIDPTAIPYPRARATMHLRRQ